MGDHNVQTQNVTTGPRWPDVPQNQRDVRVQALKAMPPERFTVVTGYDNPSHDVGLALFADLARAGWTPLSAMAMAGNNAPVLATSRIGEKFRRSPCSGNSSRIREVATTAARLSPGTASHNVCAFEGDLRAGRPPRIESVRQSVRHVGSLTRDAAVNELRRSRSKIHSSVIGSLPDALETHLQEPTLVVHFRERVHVRSSSR